MTNLQHGKDGSSKANYLGGKMKESRGNKVYTYQSEESEEEDETAPEVWVAPTIIENKSAITDKINESPIKQNDGVIPSRKPHKPLAVHWSEPDTLEKSTLNPNPSCPFQLLKEKRTDKTPLCLLQSKFEERVLKSPLEVEIERAQKLCEMFAKNRPMELIRTSRIHQNIKEVFISIMFL